LRAFGQRSFVTHILPLLLDTLRMKADTLPSLTANTLIRLAYDRACSRRTLLFPYACIVLRVSC
jgi:hypothetical protein